ncbi:profilin-2-like [Leuresthes tenuis]|uniref:profilin-2-like n=1 Tax=Leuresthes tenuis TaxID=355514 RepID=UPI003B506332
MTWVEYLSSLLIKDACQDAAVVGHTENKYVWASTEGSIFASITPSEIDRLVGKDRQELFINGLTLGSKKCSVIRDELLVDGVHTMDIRTKGEGGEAKYNISVGWSLSALVLLKGNEGVHGGVLNQKAFNVAYSLRQLAI